MNDESDVRCPKCGSDQVTANQRGVKVTRSLVTGFFLGPLGWLAGVPGRRSIIITCLACGNRWKPGERWKAPSIFR